ncbi:MAG: hypothetical protein ACXVAX_03160 [Pseudobdellovibrio sp.]
MKKNFFKILAGATMILASTGCLEKKEDPAAATSPSTAPAIDYKSGMIAAIDNQATSLIDAINKVVIGGTFIQNASKNPPQPISLQNEDDVKKAVDYLLSNAADSGQVIVYKPDPRFCSELTAKDDPTDCTNFLSHVSFVQSPVSTAEGALVMMVDNAAPFTLYYNASLVSVTADAAEIVKSLAKLSAIQIQDGHQGFDDQLPTIASGKAQVTFSSTMGINTVGVDITNPIFLQDIQNNVQKYLLQIDQAQGVLALAFNASLNVASAGVNLPAVLAQFTSTDDQHLDHAVQITFPGASGSLQLDNSVSQIAVQALKLSQSGASIAVDGVTVGQLISSSTVNAEITSYAGADISVKSIDDFSAQVQIAANPFMDKSGNLSLSLTAGTEIYWSYDFSQAKILSGEAQLTGTNDFAASLDVTAGQCVGGQNAGLQVSACQF